jgi:hypothetical protein
MTVTELVFAQGWGFKGRRAIGGRLGALLGPPGPPG